MLFYYTPQAKFFLFEITSDIYYKRLNGVRLNQGFSYFLFDAPIFTKFNFHTPSNKLIEYKITKHNLLPTSV